MLDFPEEALDPMPFFIKIFAITTVVSPIKLQRNDKNTVLLNQLIDGILRIV